MSVNGEASRRGPGTNGFCSAPPVSVPFAESGCSMPSLHKLSLKTVSTEAAKAPNDKFSVTVNMASYSEMLISNNALYQTITARPDKEFNFDDTIVWLTVDGIPGGEERLLYTSIIYRKVLEKESFDLKGDDSTVAAKKLAPISTPQSLIMMMSPCNPWSSTTTLVWCANQTQQKHLATWTGMDFERYMAGTKTAKDNPNGRVNWEKNCEKLANVIFNEREFMSGSGVEFARSDATDATDETGRVVDVVIERWERTERSNLGKGYGYNFKYMGEEIDPPGPKRPRTNGGS